MESIFQQTAFYASTAPPPYMSPAAYIDQQHPTYRQQAAAAPYSAPWQPYPAVNSAAANGVRHQDDAVSSGWSSPSPAIGSWSYSPPLLPPPPSHANMYRGQRSYCCSATTSCSQSHAMPPAASMPSPLAVAPIQQRPKLTTTLWEDQGTLCYQVDAKNICVARRQDNDEINGTKLLNVVGMSRGKRDGILKNEKDRVVIKVGAMHLKGVWIKFERAQELAKKFKVYDLLYPLFEKNPQDFISTQPSSAESTPTVAPTQADSTITDGTASGGTPYKADAYGYMPSNWDHRPYHSILRSQPATPAAAAAYSQVQCSPVPSATAPIPQQQDEYLSATLATGPMNNVPELPTNAHANLYPPFDGNDSFKSSRNREDAEQETHSEGSVEQPSKPVSNNNKRKRASVDDNDEPTDKKNNNGNSSRSPKRNRSGQ